jgi:hypothetical protein
MSHRTCTNHGAEKQLDGTLLELLVGVEVGAGNDV